LFSYGQIDSYLMGADNLTIAQVWIRLLLAVIVGGIIGLERGAHGHTAGFRTHILVCVGACLAMMTNQYMVEELGAGTDMARLGAQVITGVGFLGVGTIIVTGRHKIKGLTTAAGLWASACLGLAMGIGFYAGALIAALLIFVVLAFLQRIENYFYERTKIVDLYAELHSMASLKAFKVDAHEMGIQVSDVHISNDTPMVQGSAGVYFTVKLSKGKTKSELLDMLENSPEVYLVEEV